MDYKNNKLIIIIVLVLAALFLYFGSGMFGSGGMDGMMHDNRWMGGRMNGWFPVIIILAVGVLIGWIIFKKK